jgi:hypothetical protein
VVNTPVKPRKRRLMHGVGLLRISQTPVTVDSEEYVVFVQGWLVPRTFGSWREAMDHFLAECDRAAPKRPHRRLTMSNRKRVGRPKGAGIYEKLMENVDV